MIRVLDASPWMLYAEDHNLNLQTQLIGSRHLVHGSLAYTDGICRPARRSPGSHPTVKYKQYYRPLLRLIPRGTTSNPPLGAKAGPKVPEPLESTSILPVPRATSHVSETEPDEDMFLGRRVNAEVGFDLLRDWMKRCATIQINLPDRKHTTTQHGDYNYNDHARSRELASLLQTFRFVDVKTGCIERVHRPVMFAALSYVWGVINAYCSTATTRQSCRHLASSGQPMKVSQGRFVMLSPLRNNFPSSIYGSPHCA